MKIEPYLTKLNESKQFKDFMSKNPDAYFSAGFFVLDFETNKNLHQIDYYNPSSKDVETFFLDDEEILSKKGKMTNDNIPDKIIGNINLDLDTIKGIVEDEMKNQTVTQKIHKIIAVLHSIKGKLIWNLSCITTDMGVIKIHLEDSSKSIVKFEKVNLFDAIKKL